MAERKTYEDGWTETEKVPGEHDTPVIINTEPTDRGMYNVGVTYEQIKERTGIPTPTTDDEGKVLKVDAEGKWELATDSEGTVVVANPTLVGTEADLTGLQVGAIKYKVPQGMEVVELSGTTGTLTDAQYELASGNNCVIRLNGLDYYKNAEDSATLYYFNYMVLNEDSVLKQRRCLVERATKEYYYSTTEISISSPIAYEGTSLLPTDVVFEDWTLHRAIKDGNILWITLAGKIKNNGSSSASVVNIFSVTLPSEISSKIYRADGTSCNNPYTSDDTILSFNGTYASNSGVYILSSATANTLTLIYYSSATLSANESRRFDVRIPLYLDIGTVQQ